MESENNKFREIIRSLKVRLVELEHKNTELETKCVLLEELSKTNQPRCDSQTPDDLLQETMQRLARRKHLIVSGLPEHASGNPQERKEKDSEAIAQIASKLGINDLQPSEVSRIGRIGHSKPGVTNLRPPGRMRPAIPLHAAREALPQFTLGLRAAREGSLRCSLVRSLPFSCQFHP